MIFLDIILFLLGMLGGSFVYHVFKQGDNKHDPWTTKLFIVLVGFPVVLAFLVYAGARRIAHVFR